LDKQKAVDIITYGVKYSRVCGGKALTGASARRRRQGRPQKRWNAVEGIFFILVVLVTGYVLLRSPLFEVNRILVRGNQFLSEDKIRSVAAIGTGLNIFQADLATAASNLKTVPMIKEARVSRALPSTIVITVTERIPLGLLPAGGGFIEVDGEGVYLQQAGPGVPGLPVITGLSFALPAPGQVVQAEGLKEALAVIGGLPGELVAGLSEVHVEKDGQIIMYTADGIQCRFGQAAEIQEKGAVLSQLIVELRKQGARVKYIDLSCAGQPVVYYKKY